MSEKQKTHLKVLPTGKPHISFSELSNWISCSWSHKLRQIDKLDLYVPSPIPMFGTSVHAANEAFLRTRVMDIDIAVNMIKKSWAEMRNELPKRFPDRTEELLKAFSESDQAKYETEAMKILTEVPLFMDQNFPDWEYVDAEHQLYEDIPGFPYAFKGFIDGIITCRPTRGKKRLTWLIDWKTSSFGWRREKKQDPMPKHQLILYKDFWSRKTSTPIKDIRCGFVILKRSAKPGNHCELFPVSVGETTIQKSTKHVRNMLVSLERNVALKNRMSCQWCDFFDTQHCDSVFRRI
jgi:hypothetical protein